MGKFQTWQRETLLRAETQFRVHKTPTLNFKAETQFRVPIHKTPTLNFTAKTQVREPLHITPNLEVKATRFYDIDDKDNYSSFRPKRQGRCIC